jgi:hypothetical protein
VLNGNRAKTMEELQALVDHWVEDYNARHVNRDTACVPLERLEPSVTRTLEDGADDVFCPPKAGAQGGQRPHLHPGWSDLHFAP